MPFAGVIKYEGPVPIIRGKNLEVSQRKLEEELGPNPSRGISGQGYMSGGAGYVLSKEAVRRFVEKAIPDAKLCKQDGTGAEDAELGKCMANVGVMAGDSRDQHARGRFFPFVPEHHLIPSHTDKGFWYWKYIYYETDEGLDCCADTAISFHYISPNQMYVMDYLIYHLRPYGVVNAPEALPERLKVGETMPPPIEKPSEQPKVEPTQKKT